jgi:hypothetical protein
MAGSTNVRSTLGKLQLGTEITVRLDNGELVKGSFLGLDGDRVRLERENREEKYAVDCVQTVAIHLSSRGPE